MELLTILKTYRLVGIFIIPSFSPDVNKREIRDCCQFHKNEKPPGTQTDAKRLNHE